MVAIKSRTRCRGFSLLEAQLAFVIVAIVLAALYQTVQSSLHTTVRIDNQLQALNLAQNLLVQFSTVGDEDLDDRGDVGIQPVFSWQVKSSPLAFEGPAARLAFVRITILWDEAGRAREFVLETAIPRLLTEHSQAKAVGQSSPAELSPEHSRRLSMSRHVVHVASSD